MAESVQVRSAEKRKELKCWDPQFTHIFLSPNLPVSGADPRRITEVNSNVRLPLKRKKIRRRVLTGSRNVLRAKAYFQLQKSGAASGRRWPLI